MNDLTDLPTGIEPGLRFAVVLDGRGGGREMNWQGVAAWRPEDGFLWIHLERDTQPAAAWMRNASGVDPIVADALLAEDSRPRIEEFDEALLLVMRGVNLAEKEEVELVPVHMWLDAHRAITLRDKDHALSALRDIRIALKAGRGPRTAGALLVQIVEKIIRDVEPILDKMDATLETLEDELLSKASPQLRRTLADVRRQAIHLRRYLGPKREAISSPILQATPFLDARDGMRLRSVIDRISRCIEDLDAFRDRATILYQDLAAKIQEGVATSTYRFTIIAGLILPPSLIAAILGANIGGIPGQENQHAFLELLAVIAFIMGIQWLLLRRMKWV